MSERNVASVVKTRLANDDIWYASFNGTITNLYSLLGDPEDFFGIAFDPFSPISIVFVYNLEKEEDGDGLSETYVAEGVLGTNFITVNCPVYSDIDKSMNLDVELEDYLRIPTTSKITVKWIDRPKLAYAHYDPQINKLKGDSELDLLKNTAELIRRPELLPPFLNRREIEAKFVQSQLDITSQNRAATDVARESIKVAFRFPKDSCNRFRFVYQTEPKLPCVNSYDFDMRLTNIQRELDQVFQKEYANEQLLDKFIWNEKCLNVDNGKFSVSEKTQILIYSLFHILDLDKATKAGAEDRSGLTVFDVNEVIKIIKDFNDSTDPSKGNIGAISDVDNMYIHIGAILINICKFFVGFYSKANLGSFIDELISLLNEVIVEYDTFELEKEFEKEKNDISTTLFWPRWMRDANNNRDIASRSVLLGSMGEEIERKRQFFDIVIKLRDYFDPVSKSGGNFSTYNSRRREAVLTTSNSAISSECYKVAGTYEIDNGIDIIIITITEATQFRWFGAVPIPDPE